MLVQMQCCCKADKDDIKRKTPENPDTLATNAWINPASIMPFRWGTDLVTAMPASGRRNRLQSTKHLFWSHPLAAPAFILIWFTGLLLGFTPMPGLEGSGCLTDCSPNIMNIQNGRSRPSCHSRHGCHVIEHTGMWRMTSATATNQKWVCAFH